MWGNASKYQWYNLLRFSQEWKQEKGREMGKSGKGQTIIRAKIFFGRRCMQACYMLQVEEQGKLKVVGTLEKRAE